MALHGVQLDSSLAGGATATLLTVSLLSLAVGCWVVYREKARQVSLSFLASTVALAVYLFGFAFMAGSTDPGTALFWGKIAYLGIPFIVPSIYHFSVDLLGIGARRAGVVRAAWAIGAVYATLAAGTDLLIADVKMTRMGYITELTPWNLPILIWSAGLLLLCIHDFRQAYAGADAIQKARIRWFAIPLVIASLAFIDYAPSLGVPVLPIGFVFFPVFLLSAAWAVERYHLPDLTPAFAADQIVATMADALLVCSTNGRIAVANAAAASMLEYDPAELKDLPLSAVFGSEQAESVIRRTVLEREATAYTRSGEPIEISVSTNRIHDRAGRVIGTVVVARDIRERHRAAMEIERREQRFRALTENALDTITILDAEGRITYQSPAVRQLGYDPEDDLGRDIFQRAHAEDVARLAEAFRNLLADPGSTVEAEARILDAEGAFRTFELRGRNLLGNPAVRGIVVNGRDITEERQLAAQLQQAQKMEAIGRLAGGVAHDFNNILTAIQGNIVLLQEAIPSTSPLFPELEEVRRGAERAARLTDQLLAFSRRQVVRPQLLELGALIEELRSMLTRLIGEDISLETSLEGDLPRIRADRGHIEQVLLNLVVNGRDAVGPGGRIEVATTTVEIAGDDAPAVDAGIPAGRYVRLSVADDGHGMDSTTRSRIFEPFFTTKGQGRGTGLGLSTVYGSVRQAGGYIEVQSELGAGTRFDIYLPVAEEQLPSAQAERAEPVATPDVPRPEPGTTILVVEDEAPVRSLITKILGRRGYRVLAAQDGEDALRQADGWTGEIDLLITDLVMPGLSGREVAELLADARPGLRTIFVSGYTADEVVRRGVVSGEHVFLGKPFSPADLVSCVSGVLDGAREPRPSDVV